MFGKQQGGADDAAMQRFRNLSGLVEIYPAEMVCFQIFRRRIVRLCRHPFSAQALS